MSEDRCQAIIGQGRNKHQCKRKALESGRLCAQHEPKIKGLRSLIGPVVDEAG